MKSKITYYNEILIRFYKTALYLALEKENIEIIKLLLTKDKLDVNIIRSESLRIGLSKSFNKTIIQSNILCHAILTNKNKAIKIFLSDNNNKRIDLKDKLIEAKIGTEIEIHEKTPLFIAVENGNIEAVRLLVSYNSINVNEKSFYFIGNAKSEEKTPLHVAVEKGFIEIIKLLLECKEIDVNVEDEQGKKPIDYASNNEIKQLFNY